MKTLMFVLVQYCLLMVGSRCALMHTTYEVSPTTEVYTENLTENVVQVSEDDWNQINHVTSLADISRLLGIPSNPQHPEPQEDVLSSAFKNEPENPDSFLRTANKEVSSFSRSEAINPDKYLRNASPERYIENSDLTVCTPELRVVDLDLPSDFGVKHFPKCVKVQRCGGCCNDISRQCTAVESRKVIVKVLKLTTLDMVKKNAALRRRSRVNRRRRREPEPVHYETFNATIVEDTKCDCQCRITETDCNDLQDYDPLTCSCSCRNKDKRDKCMDDTLRYWSEQHCDCKCRHGHHSQCSTGKYFNEETCSCENNKVSSSFDFLLKRAQDGVREGFDRIRPVWSPN